MATAGDQLGEQNGLTDEAVLTAALAKPELFRVIINRYEAAFLRRARAILGSREEVADVVVETFTKIYLKGNSFKPQPGASFKSWAYKILINTALTYYRRLKLNSERFVQVEDESWSGPLGADASQLHEEKQGIKDWVASVLVRMPTQLARVLRLHFIEERSHREIAAAEGLSLSAVKTRVHRAKKAFKKISLSLEKT